jgi:hypothetical protein
MFELFPFTTIRSRTHVFSPCILQKRQVPSGPKLAATQAEAGSTTSTTRSATTSVST